MKERMTIWYIHIVLLTCTTVFVNAFDLDRKFVGDHGCESLKLPALRNLSIF